MVKYFFRGWKSTGRGLYAGMWLAVWRRGGQRPWPIDNVEWSFDHGAWWGRKDCISGHHEWRQHRGSWTETRHERRRWGWLFSCRWFGKSACGRTDLSGASYTPLLFISFIWTYLNLVLWLYFSPPIFFTPPFPQTHTHTYTFLSLASLPCQCGCQHPTCCQWYPPSRAGCSPRVCSLHITPSDLCQRSIFGLFWELTNVDIVTWK